VTGFLARKTSVVGGRAAGPAAEGAAAVGTGGGREGAKRGGADGDTGLPLPARSPRDGTTKRIAASGAREGPARPPGRGEVPGSEKGGPGSAEVTPRIYEFTRTSERASERASAMFFAHVNSFCIPLSSGLQKRLVKHIKGAR